MTAVKETAFVGRNNIIRIELYEDDVLFAAAYPGITPTKWVLTIGDEEIDSDTNPECFTWDGTNSILELSLGNYFTEEIPSTKTTLVLFSSIWPDGVVWVHPTCTPDSLYIHMCM